MIDYTIIDDAAITKDTMVTDIGDTDVSGIVYHINNDLYRQSRSHTPP